MGIVFWFAVIFIVFLIVKWVLYILESKVEILEANSKLLKYTFSDGVPVDSDSDDIDIAGVDDPHLSEDNNYEDHNVMNDEYTGSMNQNDLGQLFFKHIF